MAAPIPKTPSLVGNSDDSAVDISTGPTTPDGSPLFYPSHADIETRLSSLVDGPARHRSSDLKIPAGPLPDINDPATAGGAEVKNICCIGAGYVGGPTAAVIAFHNPQIRVTVLDRDASRIAQWQSKHLPIHEPGLEDIVRIARDGTRDSKLTSSDSDNKTSIPARPSNLFFSTNSPEELPHADVILVSVNTPTKTYGAGAGHATDIAALEGATRDIAQYAKAGAILVEKSTVPCGTSKLINDILEVYRPGVRFHILSNPEFLSEGTAVNDLMTPDRVLIGSYNSLAGHRAAAALANVYAAWVPRSRIVGTNVWSSELSKLVANSMLAQRISSINSISAICERTGADVDEIAHSIGLDPRVGPKFLKAGIGFGGSCFRKDISSLIYLSKSLNLPEVADYWQGVLDINMYQRNRFSRKVITTLNNSLRAKKITILGFAFKANTGDTRESPAVDVIRTLFQERPLEIAIYDPLCSATNIKREIKSELSQDCGDKLFKEEGGSIEVYTDPYQACANSSGVLILTDWDQFKNVSHTLGVNKPRKSIPDPRPFANPAFPTEMELYKLHKYRTSSRPSALPAPALDTSLEPPADEADRYLPEPACPDNCPDCATTPTTITAAEPLEWTRIAFHMKEPKRVFDAKGCVNIPVMEKIGFRVIMLGKTSMPF